MLDTTALPPELLRDLYESNEAMAACGRKLSASIEDDVSDYPVVMPTFGETVEESQSDEARREAIKIMTQLHFPVDEPLQARSGLLCASPSTIAAVEAFNAAKAAFKAAVLAIRNNDEPEDPEAKKLRQLLKDEVEEKGRRSVLLRQALNQVQINTLDLVRAYTQIRILPSGVESFRWTWATRHTRMKKVSVMDAYKMLDALPGEMTDAKEVATKALNDCDPKLTLVLKTEQNNKLRANYTTGKKGERQSHSCSVSGIVVCPGTELPKYKWRDDPDLIEGQKRSPRGSKVANEPFIKALGLYRYAGS